MKPIDWLFQPFEGTRNPYPVAIFRIVFFGAVGLHFFPLLSALGPESTRTADWSPWVFRSYEAIPQWGIRALCLTTVLACLMCFVGFAIRAATCAAGIGLYVLCSLNSLPVQTLALTQVWAILLLLACCGGGDAVLSFAARRVNGALRERRVLSGLIVYQLLLAVFVSGLEKIGAGWPFSNEIRTLLEYPEGWLVRDWVHRVDWLRQPSVSATLSVATVFIELATPVLLLFRATRAVSLWVYQLFFFAIVASLEVPPLFYAVFAAGAFLVLDDDEVASLVAALRAAARLVPRALGWA